jgi:hypothetical protein
MKTLLAVIAVALALPAAAQAKEINALVLCGPASCEDVDVADFGHNDPIAGASATQDGPPPSDFLRLDFTVDGQEAAFSVFYESDSGLVAVEGAAHSLEWARLAPPIAAAVKQAAGRLEPFPAPRVTSVKVGARTVKDDPSSYLALLTVEGPFALLKTNRDAVGIRFVTDHPNPWTRNSILFYPEDGVIMREGTFVKLPTGLAADIEAARPLGTGANRTSIPWLPIAFAILGAALLFALFLRTRTARRRAVVAASVLALALPAAAAGKGPVAAALCGPDACRDVGRLDVGPAGLFDTSKSQGPPPPAPYYELRLDFGRGHHSSGIYYEPRSGLVSYSEDFGSSAWAPLADPSLREAAEEVRPYPAPRVTAAWVGDRGVAGDPATYLRLLALEGPFVAPGTFSDSAMIRLDSPTPNPWTSEPLVYYPSDRVLLVPGATYVQVPEAVAADLAAARGLDDGRRTIIPWIALAVALAGAAALLLLRTLGLWNASSRPSSSSTSSGRLLWLPGRTRRSSAGV